MKFATIPNHPAIACAVVQCKKNGPTLLPPKCHPPKKLVD